MAESDFTGVNQEQTETVEVSNDTETVQVDISWPDEDVPLKWSYTLQKALQTMFNKDLKIKCDVCSLHFMDKPHSVMVKISPASVLSVLLEVKSAELNLKNLNTVVTVSFTQPGSSVNNGDQEKIPVPVSAPVYSRDANPQDQGAIMKKREHHQASNRTLSSAGPVGSIQNAGNAHWQNQSSFEEDNDEETRIAKCSNTPIREDLMECRVPVCLYSYLSSAYRKEIDNIEKRFGVAFKDAVLISIEANGQKEREQANQAFTELVQGCCQSFDSVTILKANLEPGILTEMLEYIQKNEEAKLELSVSAQGYRLSGPRESIKEFMRRIDVILSSQKALRLVLREKRDEPKELKSQHPRKLTTKAAGTSRDPPPALNEEDKCPICLDTFTNQITLRCTHVFCSSCLDQAVRSMGPQCPVCKEIFGLVMGDQPDGTMVWHVIPDRLPGFHKCHTIEIAYNIPDGIQTARHPNPGKSFRGTNRVAYLPDNREGREVLKLLEKAFEQKLIFTVGVSRTTGVSDTVIWNDIHHKTSTSGGPTSFGYPDPGYLKRVREELKDKGIK